MPIGYGSWSKPTSKTKEDSSTKPRGFKRAKGRTIKTYQNKINHLKRKYFKMFKSSKKRNTGFHANYPTVEAYLKLFKLKKSNIN